jgi:methylmalonyl-CoA mutase N-terminal domain/subunit
MNWRLWAQLLRNHYGAKKPESWRLRVHVQTGAALLTAQQPENNIVRGALQCLAAALGGVQSLAVSTYDEAFSIPSEKAQRMALRTQQIVAYETGIANTLRDLLADRGKRPLGSCSWIWKGT